MHPIVAIDEIFQILLTSVGDQVTLLSLALSCRAFYEPAMDDLWYQLEGMRPLIELLPEDARGTEGDKPEKVVCYSESLCGQRSRLLLTANI